MAFGTSTKTEKYNLDKIELIKHNLIQHQEVGKPRLYEIQVDGLRAVPKTTDTSQFENYEMYVSDETEHIKIMLFQGNSHKYDSFIFNCKENIAALVVKPTLNETPAFVEDKVKQAMRDRDIIEYKRRIVALEEELDESKDYIEEIEKQLDVLQQASSKENRLYEMAFLMLGKGTEFIKRHPHLVAKIPVVGETLAGDIAKQNQIEEYKLQQQLLQKQQNPPPPPNVTFKEKESQPQE